MATTPPDNKGVRSPEAIKLASQFEVKIFDVVTQDVCTAKTATFQSITIVSDAGCVMTKLTRLDGSELYPLSANEFGEVAAHQAAALKHFNHRNKAK